jgi:hypothetical protein
VESRIGGAVESAITVCRRRAGRTKRYPTKRPAAMRQTRARSRGGARSGCAASFSIYLGVGMRQDAGRSFVMQH